MTFVRLRDGANFHLPAMPFEVGDDGVIRAPSDDALREAVALVPDNQMFPFMRNALRAAKKRRYDMPRWRDVNRARVLMIALLLEREMRRYEPPRQAEGAARGEGRTGGGAGEGDA